MYSKLIVKTPEYVIWQTYKQQNKEMQQTQLSLTLSLKAC